MRESKYADLNLSGNVMGKEPILYILNIFSFPDVSISSHFTLLPDFAKVCADIPNKYTQKIAIRSSRTVL